VLDAGALARSAGAVALGFERFDPALRVAGIVANRVGGATHAQRMQMNSWPTFFMERTSKCLT